MTFPVLVLGRSATSGPERQHRRIAVAEAESTQEPELQGWHHSHLHTEAYVRTSRNQGVTEMPHQSWHDR
jgi:hypothetical protein